MLCQNAQLSGKAQRSVAVTDHAKQATLVHSTRISRTEVLFVSELSATVPPPSACTTR